MNSLARRRLVVLSLAITAVVAGAVGYAFAGANEWTRLGSSPSVDAKIVAVSPGFSVDKTVFVGGAGEDEGDTRLNDGLMKSVDAGRTWVKTGFTQGVRCVTALGLAPDYKSGGIVLVGTGGERGALLRSSNGGATWARIDMGVSIGEVLDIQFSPAFATDRTAFVSAQGGGGRSVFISTDAGLTWQPATTPPDAGGRMAVSPRFADDHTVLMVTSDGSRGYDSSLVRSVDAGWTWTEVAGAGLPRALYDAGISAVTDGGQSLFAIARSSATQAGVYRSTDGGATWTRRLAVNRPDAWMWSGSRFVFSPNWANDRTMFVVIDGQLYKSANGGVSFYKVGVFDLNEALAIRSDFVSAPTLFSAADSLNSGGSNQDVWTYTFSRPVKARLSKPVVSAGADMKGRLIQIKSSLRPIHVEAAPRFEYRLYRKVGTRWLKYKFYPKPTFRVGGGYPAELRIYWNSLPQGQYKVMTYHADSGEAGHLPSLSQATYFTRGSRFSFWTKR